MLRSAGLVSSKASLLPSLLTATLPQCPHAVTSLHRHVCSDLFLQGSQACWVGTGALDYSFSIYTCDSGFKVDLWQHRGPRHEMQGVLFALGFSIHS